MSEIVPITIVGGGIIGCAIAYELSTSLDEEIFLIERNEKIRGENQSSRNSGVVHAGIYYSKDTEPLKSRFCVEGNRMLYGFCEKHEVPYKQTGKLVVATNSTEEEYLEEVLRISEDNDVLDIEMLDRKQVRQYEPNVNANSALYVPSSGIVEATKLVGALHRLAIANGVSFVTRNEVISINPKRDSFEVTVKVGDRSETFETKLLINAAGLYSDRIAKMVNPDSPYRIIPVRGESAKFYKTRRGDIFMRGANVYPAPYGLYNSTGEKARVSFAEFQRLLNQGEVARTVGVHLTPTFEIIGGRYVIGKTVTIGPIPTVCIGKEDYSSNLHPLEHYLESVRGFFPGIRIEDIELHQSGIRARLNDHPDFVVERDSEYPGCINLIGIDSPGLTSSLAIAKHVGDLVREYF